MKPDLRGFLEEHFVLSISVSTLISSISFSPSDDNRQNFSDPRNLNPLCYTAPGFINPCAWSFTFAV